MPPDSPTYQTQVMALWHIKCALVCGTIIGPALAFGFLDAGIARGGVVLLATFVGLVVDSQIYKRIK